MTVRQTLLVRHGALWLGDSWYRFAWLAGPQALGLVAIAWLSMGPAQPQAPPPPTVLGRWLRPTYSDGDWSALRTLRDRATTDGAALAQLDQQALAGNGPAQFFMGTLHDPFLHFHPVRPAVPATAVAYYRRAADQGVDSAAVNLGILLFGELGAGVPKDYAEARRLFERAAPTSPMGTRELGIMKRNGWGEPMDPAGGLQKIRLAADRGDAVAQRIVGFAYDNGEDGLPHDTSEAVALFQKAAMQGDARAQRLLGIHLKAGDGIAADPVAALDWFEKAAAQGDVVAQKEIEAATPQPPRP